MGGQWLAGMGVQVHGRKGKGRRWLERCRNGWALRSGKLRRKETEGVGEMAWWDCKEKEQTGWDKAWRLGSLFFLI